MGEGDAGTHVPLWSFCLIIRNRTHLGHVPYSVFNPSLSRFSPCHLDVCHCFKAMSLAGILH